MSGAYNASTQTFTVRIKAGGDAADTAAGAGAQKVMLRGIASTLALVEEEITTAGASASSATTASFWRILRTWVSEAGAYAGANTAAVTIENSDGSQDRITIPAGLGESQQGSYSIPTGKTGYLLSAFIHVDSAKDADFALFQRAGLNDFTTPFEAKRVKGYWNGVLGGLTYTPETPGEPIEALTDIWFEAQGSGAITEVSVDFTILLIDNNSLY